MRLAVFTNKFPSRVSTFFARDIRGLIDAGIDIDVFPIYPLDSTLWASVPDILNEKVLPRDKVHHLTFSTCFRASSLPPLRTSGRLLRDAVLISSATIKCGVEPLGKTSYVFPKAWTWAQQYGSRYDHVLAYWGNYTATCAYIFCRLAPSSVPFSIFLHAGIDLYLNQVYLREKLLATTNIITCSDFNVGFLKKSFSDIWNELSRKVHVHYHGIDFRDFPFDLNHRPSNKLLAVGGLSEWKGYDYLLRAVAELRARRFDCELELVGDGNEADSLKRLAAALGIIDKVRFRGWVRPEEIPGIMSRATIFVHPSSKLGDGVPNVIKESMAVGTPVIGSDIAGIPELLKRGELGVLFPPMDVKALADAIQGLLSDPGLRDKYAVAARKYAVENFDLWRNGKALANVLRSVL
jgi:glycosyltransferase involved in cell wall biosynthesis